MLRCLHNDLVPVSIKLKSTLRSERAKKILRSAEKQLLQTRLKSINNILDNNAKQLELTRSKIASILPAPRYQQCQEFIEKIKETRFTKVRERQVRKFNNLLNKKEGSITWQSSQVFPAARAFPWANNRQVVLATRATQAANSSQAGRSITPTASLKLPRQTVLSPQWRTLLLRQAIPRLPQWIACFPKQRVQSPGQATPRQATPRLPQQIALFLRQRVQSTRQALPSLPRQILLSTNRECGFPGRHSQASLADSTLPQAESAIS